MMCCVSAGGLLKQRSSWSEVAHRPNPLRAGKSLASHTPNMERSATMTLGGAMNLVTMSLAVAESNANTELSIVEASLRDMDLSYEAHDSFIRGLRLCNAAAPHNFQGVVIDAMRFHKPTLARDASIPWAEFLDDQIDMWSSRPIGLDMARDLVRLIAGWAVLQQSRDRVSRNAARVRRLALLAVWAEARALHRAAKLTVSALVVLRRRRGGGRPSGADGI